MPVTGLYGIGAYDIGAYDIGAFGAPGGVGASRSGDVALRRGERGEVLRIFVGHDAASRPTLPSPAAAGGSVGVSVAAVANARRAQPAGARAIRARRWRRGRQPEA